MPGRTKSANPDHPAVSGGILAGRGEMATLIREKNWERTALGPIERWPQNLKMSVRLILESRYPMMVVWGQDLLQFYNDAYRPILGVSKHPMALGSPVQEIWPEAYDVIGPLFHQVLDTGEPVHFDDLLLAVDRKGFLEETHFGFSYSPIRDDEGRVDGVLVTCQETTAQVLGERRLNTLRHLASHTGDARSADEACLLAAEALATDRADLPFALIYLLDDHGATATLAGASGIGRGDPPAPLFVAFDDPDVIWPLRDALDAAEPVMVRGLQARFGDGSLTTAAPFDEPPWKAPADRAVVVSIAQAGHDQPSALLVVGISPYLEADERYRDFLGLVANQLAAAIAHARAYEDERRRAESLAELDRAKTAFFSDVSHEFRTPLTLMLGPLEDALNAEESGAGPAPAIDLAMIYRNGQRLLRLVNTLLDFSRIEAGRAQALFEPTDLPQYTEDLASTFRSATERAGLHLRVDCPPLPDDVELLVDREMWERILLNLLSNAFKFTFEGEIGVSLRVAEDRKAVILNVRDTGVGIPAEELPRLFERFHRIRDTRSRTHEGTGIGLALVQALVRLHGGEITVASEVGRGTTFTVTFPTGSAHLPSDRIAERSGEEPSPSGANVFVEEALGWLRDDPRTADLAGTNEEDELFGAGLERHRRVLLADDNADMRRYVSRLLSPRYEVEIASDGAQALRMSLERPPDLILADVMMPGMDGIELLRALRGEPTTHDVPVILLSARTDQEAMLEGLRAGADDYLTKPFSAAELLARVSSHLSLAEARREASERAREAIEAQRRRLRELFEQAPAAICLLSGPEHVYTLANPRYLELVGNRDLMGKPVIEAFPELKGQGILELLDRVFERGETVVGDEVLVRLDRDQDGLPEETYFSFVYAPFTGLSDAVEGVFVHAFDVTGLVESRQALEQEIVERERAESVLAGQRVVLELIARDERLSIALNALAHLIETEAPGVFCSILLLDPDGVHLRHGAAPSLPEEYNQAIDGVQIGPAVGSCGTAAFRGEPVVVIDIESDRLWDDYRHLALPHGIRACWSTPVKGRDGMILGTFALYYTETRGPTPRERQLVDVLTYLAAIAIERHHTEEARQVLFERERAARAEAEMAVQSRDEFLTAVAHDLRSPLTTIKGTAQLLRSNTDRLAPPSAGRIAKGLASIDVAASKVSEQIDELFDIALVRNGRPIALRRDATDLVDLSRQIASELKQSTKAHRIVVEAGEPEIVGDWDQVRLARAIRNLVGNAIKYSPDGGEIRLTLSMIDGADGRVAMLAVRDKGVGIPAADLDRVFDRFYRAGNVASSVAGTGIGLSSVRLIVEQHGGAIDVESREGEGSTFTVRLPLEAPEA